ncbi:MAG: fatty acid desaturase [Archangiaceae bacterium]|nr:fatty acid desaturase [Archangiaceae bacterium]
MKPHAPQHYRRALGALLPEAPRRDPWRLLQFWALVAAFVALQLWVYSAPSWPLAALASPVLALILVALFMLLHELMHYAIVGSRPLAWVHGFIAGFYAGLTPDSWKHEHDAHHTWLGQAIDDPDAVYDLETYRAHGGVRKGVVLLPGNHSPLSVATRPFWWMAVHAQLLFARYLQQPNVSRGKKALAVAVWVFDVTAQLALMAWLGARYAVWGFLVPVCLHNLVLMYFLLGTHLTSRRTAERDPLLGSLSMTFNPLWGWAFMDSGRHTEHHLFPQTSHRKLREVTRLLRERWADRFQEVPFAASIRALETSGRVYVADDVLWDPARDRRFSTWDRDGAGRLVPPSELGATGEAGATEPQS